MHTAPLPTDPVVSSRLRTFAKPTYLNSRFGASRQGAKSPIAQLEEMMALSPAIDFPVTPTMRLLEVSCGLPSGEVERLLASPSSASSPTVAERVAQSSFYQRFGAIVWTLFLTGGVVASLIALS